MTRWIRVQTSIFSHELFSDEPFTQREAWLWLVTKAAWKETRHRVGQTVHDVEIGSVFVTLRDLQNTWKWKSDKRVRSFLKLLENEKMIELNSDAGKTLVSICNYSKYQEVERSADASWTQPGRTKDTNTPIITSSLRSEVADKPAQKRGSRLPDDFVCNLEFAISEGLTAFQAEREACQFRDWWIQQPGQKGVKLDWTATWRTWVRNSIKRNQPRQQIPSRPPKPKNPTVANMWRDEARKIGILNDQPCDNGNVLELSLPRGSDPRLGSPQRLAGTGY